MHDDDDDDDDDDKSLITIMMMTTMITVWWLLFICRILILMLSQLAKPGNKQCVDHMASHSVPQTRRQNAEDSIGGDLSEPNSLELACLIPLKMHFPQSWTTCLARAG